MLKKLALAVADGALWCVEIGTRIAIAVGLLWLITRNREPRGLFDETLSTATLGDLAATVLVIVFLVTLFVGMVWSPSRSARALPDHTPDGGRE